MSKSGVSSDKSRAALESRAHLRSDSLHRPAVKKLVFTLTPGWDPVDFSESLFWPHSALQNKIIPCWGFGGRAFNLMVAFGKNPHHSENSSLQFFFVSLHMEIHLTAL